MNDVNPEARALLDGVADELAAHGLAEYEDFYVVGRAPMAFPSSEHIGIDFHAGAFEVWYKDMGTSRELVRTPDFERARAVFVDEALRLAGGRGRGPQASRTSR